MTENTPKYGRRDPGAPQPAPDPTPAPTFPAPAFPPPQGPAWPPAAYKSPGKHALLSFLIAGLGTVRAGRRDRGLTILLVDVIAVGLMLVPLVGFVFIPLVLAVWTFSVVDGYRSARDWNRRFGLDP